VPLVKITVSRNNTQLISFKFSHKDGREQVLKGNNEGQHGPLREEEFKVSEDEHLIGAKLECDA